VSIAARTQPRIRMSNEVTLLCAIPVFRSGGNNWRALIGLSDSSCVLAGLRSRIFREKPGTALFAEVTRTCTTPEIVCGGNCRREFIDQCSVL
jgi:hypothetical protein